MTAQLLFLVAVAAVQTIGGYANALSPVLSRELDSRIAGGTQVTDETKHPYNIWIIEPFSAIVFGGSLISDDVVLISASSIVLGRTYEIHAGDINLFDAGGNEQIRYATLDDVTIHPDYSSQLFRNDVAIIRLRQPFILNEYVNIIPLDKENLNFNHHAGELASIIGFGKTSDVSADVSYVLIEADDVPIMRNEDCIRELGFITNSSLCVDTSSGKSPCLGDTGSPLIQEINGQKTHIGLQTFFYSGGCQEGFPAGYTRTSFVVGWIESELQRKLS